MFDKKADVPKVGLGHDNQLYQPVTAYAVAQYNLAEMAFTVLDNNKNYWSSHTRQT